MKHRNRISTILIIALILAWQAPSQTTWTNLQGPPRARDLKDITVTDNGSNLYTCDKSVLFKSTDGGSTWSATSSEIASPLVVPSKPNDATTVIVGIEGSVKQSTNSGGGWDNKITLTGASPLRLAASPVAPLNMYFGRTKGTSGSSFWASSNAGTNWDERTSFVWPTDVYGIAEDLTQTNKVYVGGSDPTGAASETSVNAPNNLSTHPRGVWMSTDRGSTWTSKYMGDFNVRSVAVNGSKLYAGTATGKFAYSTNAGDFWTLKTNPNGSTAITAIRVRTSDGVVYASNSTGIYSSTNDGTNWTAKNNGLASTNVSNFVIVPSNQNTMYAATDGGVFKTTDGGANWTEVNTSLGRMPLSSVTGSGSDVWTTSGQYTLLSRKISEAWSNTNVIGFTGQHIMRTGTYLFATGAQATDKGALYRSTDNGSTFSSWLQTAQSSGNIFKGSTVDPASCKLHLCLGKRQIE